MGEQLLSVRVRACSEHVRLNVKQTCRVFMQPAAVLLSGTEVGGGEGGTLALMLRAESPLAGQVYGVVRSQCGFRVAVNIESPVSNRQPPVPLLLAGGSVVYLQSVCPETARLWVRFPAISYQRL